MDSVNHGIAFAALVSYIEDACMDDQVAPILKLTDLANLYSTRLKQLGTDVVGRIHSTKLKDRILGYFLDPWKLTSKVKMWSTFPMKMLDPH